MTAVARARPLYLDLAPDPVFGMFHEPAGRSRAETGVLVCPPWGWDDVTTYRARRAWADHLAGAGYAALRIDLPGSGDSGGFPGDQERLDAWSAAIAAGAAWLRDAAGCRRVALIGLGLGGLVAGKAIAEGARVDDLILWATPMSGRGFLREARAFSQLQSSHTSLTGDPEPSPLLDGWLEVGGFVLSAATIQALEPLTLTSLKFGGVQRALLLERDGIAVDPKLRRHLEAAEVDVTVAPGPGWGAMSFHPERYAPAVEVFERVASWLSEAPRAEGSRRMGSKGAKGQASAREAFEFTVGDSRIRETPLVLDFAHGQLLGILAEPVEGPRTPLCAVFLNAGAVRRIGPNRLWVEASRRWAARGVPSLRIDLEGIGDADGDARRFVDVGEFYTPQLGAQVQVVLDALEARGSGRRFVLVGLCSGAYWGLHTAARDERVTAAFLLNPRALIWDPDLETRRRARKVHALLRPEAWRKILGGGVEAARLRAAARGTARALVRRARVRAITGLRGIVQPRGPEAASNVLDDALDRLRDTGTRVVIAFSADEPLHRELLEDGLLARLDRWPNLSLRDLPGRDHTVRPIAAQCGVHDLLDAELAVEISRIADGAADTPAPKARGYGRADGRARS